jgi:hypothetical protein
LQDDQDRAFDAKFESHPDGYIVFTRRGAALFSVEERDAYIAAHRKAKPVPWKIFLWTVVGIIAIALVEFVLINAALGLWPASPLRNNVIIASVLLAPAGLFVGLFVGGVLPVIRLIQRVNLEADQRPIVAPPRKRLPRTQRLTNLAAFLGMIGFIGAMIAGWVTFTWPWILAGCAVAALVVVAPGAPPRNAKSPRDRQ